MKLSMSLIKHLEEAGTWKNFRDEYETIHKRDPAYANTFAGMLEIAWDLTQRNQDYMIIGGLAVASYVYQMNPEGFTTWRGTEDIDLLVPDKKSAESVLKGAGYEFRGSLVGKLGVVGRVYDYVKEDNGEITVVGLREGIAGKNSKDITNYLLNNKAVIPVHAIKVAVPMLRDLIEMKRWANRDKDRQDRRTLKALIKKI